MRELFEKHQHEESASGRGDAELAKALELSEQAIKVTKKPTPHFYETRGQILYRLKRYADAIPDLERAMTLESLRANAREPLAGCDAQLGDDALDQLDGETNKKADD